MGFIVPKRILCTWLVEAKIDNFIKMKHERLEIRYP